MNKHNWQPIETAPKDGTRILAIMYRSVVIAAWDDDRCAKHPKPHFVAWSEPWGITADRKNQPKYWMPLPPLPETE